MLPPPVFQYREDVDKFELKQALKTPELTIPPLFLSDGFTVPWCLSWFLSRIDKGLAAAWVHDYCYTNALKSKGWADRLFYRNLRRCGVPRYKSKLMYFFVCVLGRGNY